MITKLFPNIKVTSSVAQKKINFTYSVASQPVFSEPVTEAVLKNGMPARAPKKPGPYSWSIATYYDSHTYTFIN
ncbi:hypothetical protein [Domibacillus indicus]|uniref:hypothetical protein n=1 Tax=Domibacillus indicus TaxID=1437523 RepID=UPI000617DFA4|nr:hypothetical protein [Domibacillus indicus]